MFRAGDVIQGRYRVLRPLGEGSMGEVLLVHDLNMERAVAMKILKENLALHEDRLLRFVDEAKCQARLQHPGVISVYDIGRVQDGRLFFTMRAVKGTDFDRLIQIVHRVCEQDGIGGESDSGWNFRRLIQALRQCSEAVAFAHEQGVIHRDLKPQNLTVGPHGDPMVLDWGIAKMISHSHVPSTMETLERYLTPIQPDQLHEHEQDDDLSAFSSTLTPVKKENIYTPKADFEVFREYETVDDEEGESKKMSHDQIGYALSLDETPLVGLSIEDLENEGNHHRAFEVIPSSVGYEAHEQIAEWFTSSRIMPNEKDSLNQALQSLSRLSHSNSFSTLEGTITGTPAYMSPEQAKGQSHRVNATTDVYALGCILYHILSGRPPYTGTNLKSVLENVKQGRFPKLIYQESSPFPPQIKEIKDQVLDVISTSAPDALIKVCQRAMMYTQEERFSSAKSFAEALGAWLDGIQQRQEALALLTEIPELKQRQGKLLLQAKSLDLQAKEKLSEVPSWANEQEKAKGWALEDEARRLRAEIEQLDLEIEFKLRSAQRLVGSLPELHYEAASYYVDAHQRLMASKRNHEARRAFSLLEEHAHALPQEHPQRSTFIHYLKGEGTLILALPSETSLSIHPEHMLGRRLQFMDPITPSNSILSLAEEDHTPAVLDPFSAPVGDHFKAEIRCQLPKGSYLCQIKPNDSDRLSEGAQPVRYHVQIEPLATWSCESPLGGRPATLKLPLGQLSKEDRFVPGGWCWIGDLDAPRSLPPARVWIDDFVIRAYPVTHEEYLFFLNDLVRSGCEDFAREHAPQELASSAEAQSKVLYEQDQDGLYRLPEDTGPLVWSLDKPVTMVNWWNACAYAEWYAEQSQRPWRLPSEWEWEKAARGVDGRSYPWGGTYIDPSWCCNRLSQQSTPSTSSISQFEIDCSPYGVRGMAGNIADWCLTPHLDEPSLQHLGLAPTLSLAEALSTELPARVAKGGAWDDGPSFCHLAIRHRGLTHYRRSGLGFRLAYQLADAFKEGG